MAHPAFHLKFGKPVADLDDYVSRLLADEHEQHRTPHALCPRCSPGVRTWREVVPPRERRPEPAAIRPGPKQKTWPWYERVRAAKGEWLVVDRRGSASAAKTTMQRWKRRGVPGFEFKRAGCEISARWREA